MKCGAGSGGVKSGIQCGGNITKRASFQSTFASIIKGMKHI